MNKTSSNSINKLDLNDFIKWINNINKNSNNLLKKIKHNTNSLSNSHEETKIYNYTYNIKNNKIYLEGKYIYKLINNKKNKKFVGKLYVNNNLVKIINNYKDFNTVNKIIKSY